MTKRAYIWAGGLFILLLVCAETPLLASIFSVLVLGMVPGTNLTVPSWIILVGYPILFLGTVYWLSTQSLFIGEKVAPVKATRRKKTTKKKTTTTTRKRASTAKRRPRTAS